MRGLDRLVLPYPRGAARPLVFGHRGASGLAPENTLEAFALAAEQGADGVELDAMVCGTGEVVVCHDPWLDWLAHAHVLIHESPLAALKRLDVARHRSAWGKPEQLPTLDEVLEAVPGLLVNIELKEERLRDTGLAAKVATIVRRHRAERRVLLSSFNPLELLRLRARAPRLPLAFLFEPHESRWLSSGLPAPLLGAQAVHVEQGLCTPRRIARWKAAGFRIGAWTVDDPVRAVQLAALGVDAVITNFPGRIRAALEG